MPLPAAHDAKGRSLTDEALVAQLQEGRRLALNELMARYKSRLFSFILRHVRDQETAYDLLQETFTKAYFKARQFDPRYRFSTWIYTIALNLCRDHGRRAALARFVSLTPTRDQEGLPPELLIDERIDIEHTVAMRKQLAALSAGIDRLPKALRSALLLYAVEGHSQQDCAAILGVSEKTVEMRVYRARKQLVAWLESNDT